MWKSLVVGPLQTNCYIYYTDRGDAWIIDPGADAGRIQDLLAEGDLTPRGIIFTHGHLDHIAAAGILQEGFTPAEEKVPLLGHQSDALWFGPRAAAFHREDFSAFGPGGKKLFSLLFRETPELTGFLQEGRIIEGSGLRVIETPGHSPGGICLFQEEENLLFSGDTLFCPGQGRTDFRGGSFEELQDSLARLNRIIHEDTLVLPGHGPEGRGFRS